MVFHWSLSDSKSLWVVKTFLGNFPFFTILFRVFIKWRKVVIICILFIHLSILFLLILFVYCCLFLALFFRSNRPKKMSSSVKCNVLYFVWTGTGKYLWNVFFFPFLDHTRDSHYYWLGGSFKMPHFFFPFLSPNLCISFFFNCILWLIRYYLLVLQY